MTLEQFVRTFDLAPIVPIRQAYKVAGCSQSKLYTMAKEKPPRLRIVPRAGGVGVPAVDLYKLYQAAVGTDDQAA